MLLIFIENLYTSRVLAHVNANHALPSIAVGPGSRLSKECVPQHTWALKPLAVLSPSQPIHSNSLFEIVQQLLAEFHDSVDPGASWLLVYDLKCLMQQLSCHLRQIPH